MGALNQDGSLDPINPISEIPAQDRLASRPAIFDTYSNAVALDSVRDDVIINQLKNYIQGTPILVTYYHQISSNASNSSGQVSPDFSSSGVNISFTRIEKFELKLMAEMSYSFEEGSSASSITGQAMTYPGITPKIGDLFLYSISPGKIGVFKLSKNPERRTYHNATAHVISFDLWKFLDTTTYQQIEERVRESGVFDKQRFLNEPGALITHQEVLDLSYLEERVASLIRVYEDRYFDSNRNTFWLEGGAYDPYLVDFYREAISCYTSNDHTYIRLPQCPELLRNKQRSLYASILGTNPWGTPLLTWQEVVVEHNQYSSMITSLIGESLVFLTATSTDDSVLNEYISSDILSMVPGAQDTFDKLVTLFLEQKSLCTAHLKYCLDNVLTIGITEGFYQIPILIYLSKLAIKAIHYGGQHAELVNYPLDPYIHIPFTAEDVDIETNEVTIDTLQNKAIALLDDNDELINISDSVITYTDTTLTIDLTAILLALEIETVSGTWKIVVNNTLQLEDGEGE